MAKTIRWKIPFVSLSGTQYRVDIYDEGTFTPVQLTAGETPFVTDEDNSDDFFYPVRSQSGTLQVCTLKPDGTYITLDELLPANNIARPVRLINLDNSNAIEWQGFLSCEAYSQDYTGIPQNLDLPVISVLEAMDSVEVNPTKLSGLNTVGETIQKLLEIFIEKAGVSYFSQYYIPTAARGSNIVGKYIDATVLFEQKETNNENRISYIISGLSIKDCLERIAVYMGWCVRENNISLFFMAAEETTGYRRFYRQGRITTGGQVVIIWTPDLGSYTPVVTDDIANQSWRGTGHQRTISQGAKSVEVVASIRKYELQIELPDFPAGDISTYYNEMNNNVESEFWTKVWWYMVASKNIDAYGNIKLGFWALDKSTFGYNCSNYGASNITDVLAHMWQAGSESSAKQGLYGSICRFHAGAFFTREAFEDEEKQTHDTSDGLHCVFFPYTLPNESGSDTPPNFDPAQVGYIAQMSSIVPFWANGGYLNLTTAYELIYYAWSVGGAHVAHVGDNDDREWRIGMRLQFGENYWNGTTWQSAPCLFEARFIEGNFKGNWEDSMLIKKTDGLLIPITYAMSGTVILEIWPSSSRHGNVMNNYVFEAQFKEMSVSYIAPIDDSLSDRGENNYFQLLGTNFRDEISIRTEIASKLYNNPSPSLIMNSETEAMTELNYGTDQVPDMRRPEVDLLNRLAAYYGEARQRLELDVAHPTAAPLPLLKLNGINDGKVYLPLSESRDWRTNVCKLTCFECPTT